MATATTERLDQFEPNIETCLPQDRLFLDYKDEAGEHKQLVIMVDEVLPMGLHDTPSLVGMAVNRDGSWCGPWGRIISYAPLQVGEKTNITFNQTAHVARFQAELIRLVRVRGDNHELLLGEWPRQ